MVGIPPEIMGIVLAAALAYFAAQGIWHGVKAGAHKTKCGVMLVVGKHCDEPKPPTADSDDTP